MTVATAGLQSTPTSTPISAGSTSIKAAAEFAELPEFENCVNEFTKDQIVAAHFDKNISTGTLGAYRGLTASTAVTQLIQSFLSATSAGYEAEYIEHVYHRSEDTFYCDTLECEAIAPLQGWFISDAVQQHHNDGALLRLSDEVEIRALSPQEKRCVYQLELVRRQGLQWTDQTFAITVKYRVPKILMRLEAEDSPQQQATAEQRVFEANDRIDELLQTLRIFREDNIRQGGVLHRVNSPVFAQVCRIFSKPLADPLANALSLYVIQDAKDLESLKHLWQSVQSAKAKGFRSLIVAMRRFSDADERHHVEDRIIDLMISAEALAQASNSRKKGETIAAYIASHSPLNERQAVLSHMRDTYRLRNSIMHEGDASAWLTKKHMQPHDLRPFVGTAETYLRHALRARIQQAAK
jgi:hypothetical protein